MEKQTYTGLQLIMNLQISPFSREFKQYFMYVFTYLLYFILELYRENKESTKLLHTALNHLIINMNRNVLSRIYVILYVAVQEL